MLRKCQRTFFLATSGCALAMLLFLLSLDRYVSQFSTNFIQGMNASLFQNLDFVAKIGSNTGDWPNIFLAAPEIETYNKMARYNLIDIKYIQMAFRSPSDGAPISPYQQSFGQTKVSGDCQREITHDFCCLAAEQCLFLSWQL